MCAAESSYAVRACTCPQQRTDCAVRESHSVKRYRYGVGLGLALGAGIGVAMGTAMHNVGGGLVIGAALGVALGAAFSRRT